MKQEQFELLQLRAEQLTDIFLSESDPATWPGHGIDVGAMDKQTRGDRYWSKKNCVATLSVVQRIANVMQLARDATAGGKADSGAVIDPQEDLDKEAADAEKQAEKLLKEIQSGSRTVRKAKFDKIVHGAKA